MEERCCNENVLLISIDTLKSDSHLDENVNDKDIRIAIKTVQDIIVSEVIGTCLLKSIEDKIYDNSICLSENSSYKNLIDNYLKDIFVWGVPANLPIPLTYKIRNAGEIKTNSENMNQSALDDINYTIQWYKNKMDFYVKRAIDYLICNQSCYPELCCCCECGWYRQAFRKQPSVPLNLSKSKRFKLRRGYHATGWD